METFSERFHHAVKSGVSQPPASTSRPPLSEHPTFTSATDHGLFSPSSVYDLRTRGDMTPHENGGATPRVRIQENTPDRQSTPSEPRGSRSRTPQSVPMEVDHLKSLITMARVQRESEPNDSSHLASLLSYCLCFVY